MKDNNRWWVCTGQTNTQAVDHLSHLAHDWIRPILVWIYFCSPSKKDTCRCALTKILHNPVQDWVFSNRSPGSRSQLLLLRFYLIHLIDNTLKCNETTLICLECAMDIEYINRYYLRRKFYLKTIFYDKRHGWCHFVWDVCVRDSRVGVGMGGKLWVLMEL